MGHAVNEAYTTRACHACGSTNTVIKKRSFRCKDCGSSTTATSMQP
ncbi:MAG: zinc ribbon domain-containing protein [Candidatus Hydrothermarchaeales archaeon]